MIKPAELPEGPSGIAPWMIGILGFVIGAAAPGRFLHLSYESPRIERYDLEKSEPVSAGVLDFSERGVIELDDERKAAMVSNLMVVLCSERDTQPVVNAGTLYQ